MQRWWRERASPRLVAHLPEVFDVTKQGKVRHGEHHVNRLPSTSGSGSASAARRTRTPATTSCTHRNATPFVRSCWGSAVCGASAAAGTSMVAALRVQHRLCASQVNRTSPRKAAATSEKEFQREFFEHSLVQRLAAVTVAKFQLIALQQQRAQKAASSEDTVVYMPMFDFVCRVPSLVRDDMFRRQQDAMRWVEASPLLELVDQDGSRIWSNTTPCFMTGSATSGNDGCAPSYNPLLHVRVVAPPEWFQRIEAAESSVPHNTTRSSASTQSGGSSNGSAASSCGFARGLAGEDFRVAVQDALVRALRVSEDCAIHKAAKVAAQQNNSTLNAATADGCDGGCTAAQRSSSVCRYVPLVNALNQIHLEAAEANNNVRVSMPTATQETLQALSMETLEQVVDACGLLVTVGRRLQCDEYPALTAKCLWVVRSSQLPHQRRPSVFVALRHAQDTEPPRFRFVHPRVTVATVANNYGGWGCESNVPTKADVYEILKYIPVNWGSMSHLTIPIDVKKQRIRCSSSQQWFRRQPYYFELRNINGTVEIRRSIVLHPEAHGLTKEEACELLELQLATGEANNLVLLEGSGTPADYGVPLLERTAIKFLLRVCPTYFAPISLVAQRYIKKNLSEAAMVAVARKRPQDFEELTTRFSDAVLLRRRGGADSSRWRAAFVADLEKYPEDVRGIIALCNRMCPSWDRPEFIYVRLGEDEKQAIGGYEGMMRILQRHPTIFRAGKHFVCRADPSNPLTLQEVEPPLDDVTARSVMREENPYQSALDVALVFHYVAPDKEPCTAAYLADCASPAMRCVLPTRLVTVVQQFPKLFACTETSPGVFAIRKLKQRVLKPTAQISEEVVHSSGSSSTNTNNDGTVAATDSDESLIQMLEDEIAEEEHLTKEEVVHAVHTLVPDSGVEAPQLLQWASMSVQRAANEYFGGVLKLTEAMPQHFRVVTTEQAKTIYKK